MDKKKNEIVEALSQDPVDMKRLHELSRSEGGFVSNALRSRVWPKLLGINRYVLPDYRRYVASHRDDRQIGCDVDRSFWSLDVAKNWGERRLHRKRAILSDIITAVLCRHSQYYYFQGFHDIVSVLILVYNDSALAYATTEVLCDKYLFDFMRKDFSSLSKTMKMIMVLIKCADSHLASFLESCGTEPFFATSWLITWLSHDIRKDPSLLFHLNLM
jgi:TBC1 domain family member 20